MRLGCDHVCLSATPMLMLSANPGEPFLVTTSPGMSAKKKGSCDNQARSFGLS